MVELWTSLQIVVSSNFSLVWDGTILPTWDYRVLQKSVFFPFNCLFIDEKDCLVKMSGCWPYFVLHVQLTNFGPGLSSHTCKKKLRQYPAILTSPFVNNPLYELSFIFTLSSVRSELVISKMIVIQFFLVRCHNWNSNSPYWMPSCFILSSVRTEIVILHTDCHSVLSCPVSELK